MNRDSPMPSLASLSFFEEFTEGQVAEVAAVSRLRSLVPREPLSPDGEALRCMVMVVQGNLEVQSADGSRRLSILRPGDTWGLAELFEAGSGGTLLRSVSDARVLELDRDGFLGLCARGDELSVRLAARVANGLAAALRHADEELDRRDRMSAVASPQSRPVEILRPTPAPQPVPPPLRPAPPSAPAPRPSAPPSAPASPPSRPAPPPSRPLPAPPSTPQRPSAPPLRPAPVPPPKAPPTPAAALPDLPVSADTPPEPPPDLPEEDLQQWMDEMTAGRKDLSRVRSVESREVKIRPGRGHLF